MSWVATAIAGTGLISAYTSGKSADKASDASLQASQTQAGYQQQALDYLKQQNKLPTEIRDQALKSLQNFYQVPNQPKPEQELITDAMGSPLYNSIMGTQQAGEKAILRNASATGNLRSGTSIGALTDYGQQTANRALLESYNDTKARDDASRNMNLNGLNGLAGIPTNTNAIATATSDVGKTLAQGQVASGQSQQIGDQNSINNLLGFGSLALKLWNAQNPPGGTSTVNL